MKGGMRSARDTYSTYGGCRRTPERHAPCQAQHGSHQAGRAPGRAPVSVSTGATGEVLAGKKEERRKRGGEGRLERRIVRERRENWEGE